MAFKNDYYNQNDEGITFIDAQGKTWTQIGNATHPERMQFVDPSGRVTNFAEAMEARAGGIALQNQMGGSSSRYTPEEIARFASSTQQESDLARRRDEQEYGDLEKEFVSIPERLRDLYTTAAKRGGTYANTNEFNVGLESETNQGTRGAQAILGARLAALRERLGKPALAGQNPFAPVSTSDSENKVGDTAAAAGVPDAGAAAGSAEPVQQETKTVADEQNAITKVSDPDAIKKKLTAVQSYDYNK